MNEIIVDTLVSLYCREWKNDQSQSYDIPVLFGRS